VHRTRTCGREDNDRAYWAEVTSDSDLVVPGYAYEMNGATQIMQSGDEGFMLCGHSLSYPPGGTDIRMPKLDPEGATVGAEDYGGGYSADYAHDFCQLPDANCLVTASNCSEGIYILKIKAAGDVLKELPAGYHSITCNGRTAGGLRASTGVYFYRIGADGYVETREMLLLG
jgi:hypothetical protein